MLPNLITVLVPTTVSFFIGIIMTPILTHYLYKYRAWKKRPGKESLDGTVASEFNRLHNDNEIRAPRMGGIVIWGSVIITAVLFSFLSMLFPKTNVFNFVTRHQTWIPLASLIIGSFFGLVDDLLVIRPNAKGLALRYRLLVVIILSTFIGWWFWAKLGIVSIAIPFIAPLYIGILIIPFFVFVSLCLYASGVIDGIDGLSGGVFGSLFAAYAIIAFVLHQTELAALCGATVGGLLAFLWYNIPPARFYMTDTGTMGLTLMIASIAFLTDSFSGGIGIAVLPIIGFLLVITVLSDVLQILWKRIFKRKLFRIAPLHHHFEAIGWPGYKVVMRYWIISVVCAALGVMLVLINISA